MADIESLLAIWLTGQFSDCRVCTETPADLETLPRTIQVVRAGGPSRFTVDLPRLVLHSYAIADGTTSARAAARALAYRVDEAMRFTLHGADLGSGVYVGSIGVVSGPSFVPDPNTTLRHFAATYTPTVTAVA